MFTQRISMDCTKEQYEKYLKEGLLKMGHEEYSVNCWNDTKFHYICNNYGGYLGGLGTTPKDDVNDYGRTYLGSFNAPLFLALAAMTDSPTGSYREYYTNGIEFVCLPFTSVGGYYSGIWRKATKEEIIALFSEKKCNHNTLENKIDQLNEKGKIEINISFDATELESEMSSLIDELWDSIEKSRINFLKSKGYKILKPKTWEEV